MPVIRFTSDLSCEQRDQLFLNNMQDIVLEFQNFERRYRKFPSLSWYRKMILEKECLPEFVTWEFDIDHIIPRKLAGPVNHPKNLIIIPKFMNRSFGKLVDKDKVNYVGNEIFKIATDFLKEKVEQKEEFNIFAQYSYVKKRI